MSSGNYTLSQTVTDMETGRYENELRAADIADLVGNFSCTVSNSRGSSDPVEVTLNGESSHHTKRYTSCCTVHTYVHTYR